jgi:hypothetical protein
MPKALHTMRSRRFRLLASLLVMMAILCNGIGLAQAHSAMAKKDCCAEMMGKKMSPDKPCTMPDKVCDDQCMARCMSVNAIFSVPLVIASSVLIATPIPQLETTEHSWAEFGPGLRPPIYS